MIEDTFMSSKWVHYLVFLEFLNSLIEIKTLPNIHATQQICQYNFYATKNIFVFRNTLLKPQTEKKQKNNMYSNKYVVSDLYISTDTVIKKIQTNYGS